MSGDVYKQPVTIELGGPGKPMPPFMMAATNRCISILRSLPEPRRYNMLQTVRIIVTNAYAAAEWRTLEERDEWLRMMFDCVVSDLARWDAKLASVAPP